MSARISEGTQGAALARSPKRIRQFKKKISPPVIVGGAPSPERCAARRSISLATPQRIRSSGHHFEKRRQNPNSPRKFCARKISPNTISTTPVKMDRRRGLPFVMWAPGGSFQLGTDVPFGRCQRFGQLDRANHKQQDRPGLFKEAQIAANLAKQEQHADGNQHCRAHQRPARTSGALASRCRGHFQTSPTRGVSYDSAASGRLLRSEALART